MKTFIVIHLLIAASAAYDALYITFYPNSNCTGNQQSINLTDIASCRQLSPFNSFQLNRSMSSFEQLDFTESSTPTQCTGFLESVWNWDTSCRSVNTSTCATLWTNIGLLNDTPGVGWGWNNTVWVNITGD